MTTLYLDLGNSRLKYWVMDSEGNVLEHDAKLHLQAPAELLMGLADKFIRLKPSFVGISSVLGDTINRRITKILDTMGVQFEFTKVQANHTLLTSDYDETQLGVDRWLQMLGAVDSQKQQIIVGCGTAVTIDIVQYGHHLGGYIFPNAYLQRKSLDVGTKQIDVHSGKFDSIAIATNTSDAVNHGVLLSIIGAIEFIITQHLNYDLVITGGTAQNIIPHLRHPSTFEPSLLLAGLARYFHHYTPPSN